MLRVRLHFQRWRRDYVRREVQKVICWKSWIYFNWAIDATVILEGGKEKRGLTYCNFAYRYSYKHLWYTGPPIRILVEHRSYESVVAPLSSGLFIVGGYADNTSATQ